MLSLPIAHREMLVQAKSPALHRGRVKASIVLLLLGLGFALLYRYAGIAATRQVVLGLTFVAMMICAFGGVSVTADCISREKRDGTLGLLFLTHLRPAEIALGKLVASGLVVFYGLLIALPLFSLFVIVGGIAWGEVIGMAVVSLNILFTSAAIGLYASAISVDRKKASGRGVWIVLFFWWLLPMGAQAALHYGAPLWVTEVARMFSFNSGFGTPAMMRGPTSNTPLNVLCVHLIGWAFVAAAIYYLPRKWQDHPATPKLTFREWWKQFTYGKGEARRTLREKLLNRTPFLWLASRDRARRWHVWGIVSGMAAVLLIALPKGTDLPQSLMVAVLTTSAVLQFLWAGAGTYQLELEREQGTVEMLLSTPLKPQEISRGQLLALVRQFGGPILFVLAAQWLLAAYLVITQPFVASVAVGSGLVVFSFVWVFNFYALHHCGMWSAVTTTQQKQAGAQAIMQGVFLPILVIGVLMMTLGLLNWLFGLLWRPDPVVIFVLWVILQIANNLFWIALAKRRLPVKMREWAMQRYTQAPDKPGWFDWTRRLIRFKPMRGQG